MPSDPGAASKLALVHRFFSGTGSSYDLVVNAATFGIDRRWKRLLVDAIPPGASRILELACGTGILTLRLAARYPEARVVGVELREEYLRFAREKIAARGLDNVELVLGRAEDYRPSERFDCIVSSYLAKYADLAVLVANARALLVPGGLLLAHDFTLPPTPFLVAVFRLYFAALQRLASPLLPAWRDIFFGLPALIERSTWADDLAAELRGAGFVDIERADLTLYGSAIVSARRAPPE